MTPEHAAERVFQAIVEFFKKEDWKVGQIENRLVLQMVAAGKNGNYPCLLQVRPDRPLVMFYTIVGFRVPEEKLTGMAEYLARANYGMCLGNFEMDYADGEVRFKTSIDVRDGELTYEMIEALVMANLFTIDRYVPGIMSVVYADAAPDEAVKKVEGNLPLRSPLPVELQGRRWPRCSPN